MEPRDHWQAVYRDKRPDELSWYQPSPEPSLAALDRIGAAPEDSLVDVGAGASTLADALLGRGWIDLTCLDIAASALEASRARLGAAADRIHWEVADVTQWRPGRTFAIWHDRAVFHFLTEPAQRSAYVRTLEATTQTGSKVILATFALDGPDKCSGLPVQRYDAVRLAAELGDRFDVTDSWLEAHVTPWGAEQHFQWTTFCRTE